MEISGQITMTELQSVTNHEHKMGVFVKILSWRKAFPAWNVNHPSKYTSQEKRSWSSMKVQIIELNLVLHFGRKKLKESHTVPSQFDQACVSWVPPRLFDASMHGHVPWSYSQYFWHVTWCHPRRSVSLEMCLISEHFKVGFKKMNFNQMFFSNIRAEKWLLVLVSVCFYTMMSKPLWCYKSSNPGLSTLLNFPSPTKQAFCIRALHKIIDILDIPWHPRKKRTSANCPRKIVVSFDVFPFWGSF